MRASVLQDRLDDFLTHTNGLPNVVGVFADPKIQAIQASCPSGPVGTDIDVARLLMVEGLGRRGMDGTGVRVAVVDTGINLRYLNSHGKTPEFDSDLSWGPLGGQPLGSMPVSHGTMCAYDICIAAPRCTLADLAVLTSNTQGGSTMDGLLSDAVRAYGMLLSYLTRGPQPFAGDHVPRTLVINNSWGMFHSSWDFPVGNPQNYSDNPEHPFNIQVGTLEAAGADILFAAGNYGADCPDLRCQGLTNAGIFGANSSPSVTCVAGVVLSKQRVGYSTQGPGRLDPQKPDLACYTHFAGSGVYSADGGTSAATPVLAGVVAAIRRLYPSSALPPADLRDLLRNTAEKQGGGFNYDYGHGVIDVGALLSALEQSGAARTKVFALPPASGQPAVPNIASVSSGMAPLPAGAAQNLESAFGAFESAFRPGGGGVAPGRVATAIQPCESWKHLRGTVRGVVTALRALGSIFPVASKAADVVDVLSGILDQVCGVAAS
jgi:subtilisin family serine protease